MRVDILKELIEAVNVVNCEEHECARIFTPCGLDGRCIPQANSWSCVCKSGLTGDTCQKSRCIHSFYC